VCERHTYRLQARFSDRGEAGLAHGLRGKPSNYHRPPSEREKVLELYRISYADYGPTLFCEELARRHGIVVDHETVRRWLHPAGLWAAATKKHPHRRTRPRRTAIGDMVQFDGSPHDWFEGRGPECTLLHAIDDASNLTFLRFAKSENTIDVMRTMRQYVELYGIPRQLYVDFGSFYKDGETPTQFERAMKDLGTEIIHAHSPQAKGRVERGNRTHQDRLIKAMRQEGISTIEQGNAFLDRTYLRDHNQRFANPENLLDVHASVAGRNLDIIFFYIEETRVVANDYTIQLNARYIQIKPGPAPIPPPRTKIFVRTFLDGSLHLYWNEHELNYKKLSARPRNAKRAPVPAATHPWKAHNQSLRSFTARDTVMTPP
jgi:transposase